MGPAALARAAARFRDQYGTEPTGVARAPGRVNLIGEHTDYNAGFVLPMGLPFDTAIAFGPTGSQTVEVSSAGFGKADFALGDAPETTVPWARYAHGVAHVLADEGHDLQGWRGCIETDIPPGASLSSSAALEVAVGLVFAHLSGTPDAPGELARVGQRVENEVFGLPSGILDQLASAGAVDGHATFIDCRDLSHSPIPMPDGVTVVVMDTGTRRELVDSEYADRQATCARVAEALSVAALRDATLADLDRLEPADSVGRRRAHHVITENQRTLDATAAMRNGDAVAFGSLMSASHQSLRDDYEVSGPALDRIVAVAAEQPGCLGARMTGGGFAGGAIALVTDDQLAAFTEGVLAQYQPPAEQPAVADARLWPVRASAGASVVS